MIEIPDGGLFLDAACGASKSDGAVGMDIRDLPGVDIVHDLRQVPWPLPAASCRRILMSHIVEHLPPDTIVAVMDEAWRIMRPWGQLLIAMPYGTSPRALQDPTHFRCWNETCALYFTPSSPLYTIYKPKPWKLEINEWNAVGDITVIMSKVPEVDALEMPYGKG